MKVAKVVPVFKVLVNIYSSILDLFPITITVLKDTEETVSEKTNHLSSNIHDSSGASGRIHRLQLIRGNFNDPKKVFDTIDHGLCSIKKENERGNGIVSQVWYPAGYKVSN